MLLPGLGWKQSLSRAVFLLKSPRAIRPLRFLSSAGCLHSWTRSLVRHFSKCFVLVSSPLFVSFQLDFRLYPKPVATASLLRTLRRVPGPLKKQRIISSCRRSHLNAFLPPPPPNKHPTLRTHTPPILTPAGQGADPYTSRPCTLSG